MPSAPRALGKTVGVGAVVALGAGAQLAVLVLLGRVLDATDYGRFTLVFSVSSVVGTLSLVGQSSALAQAFAREHPAGFRWRRPVALALGRSALLALGLTAAAGLYYGLSPAATGIVGISALGLLTSQLLASGIVRNAGRMMRGIWLLRGWTVPLLLAVAVLAAAGRLTGPAALWSLGGALAVALVASLTWGVAGIPEGAARVAYPLLRMGALFWIVNVTLMATRHLDRLVLGRLLAPEALGAYQAVLTLTMAFDLAMVAAGYVLLPVLARMRRVSLGPLTLGLLGVAVLGAAGYALLGRPVLHLAYEGRYDSAAALFPWLVAAGTWKVVYALPTALIGGRLGPTAVRRFALLNLPLLVIHATVTILATGRYGLAGAAAAQAVGWGLRTLAGYAVVFAGRRHLGEPEVRDAVVRPAGGGV